ncbi:MAG: Magnesium and cobalt transport protein CorA [Myxococcaceae bacterium]|nr:Magnesium and cobalt transport protein CorA [Myxococcaceae bacterium]
MKALILEGDKAVSTTRLSDVEAAHAAGKTFWLELDEKSEEATTFLEQTLEVHPLAIEDVWNDVGLPKVEDFDDYVQVIIHGLREDDQSSDDVPLQLAELDLLIGKNWLVTHAHDEQVCAVTPIQDEIQRSAKLLKKGPAWVAHALMDRMVDAYMPLIDKFDTQIEGIETQILQSSSRSDREVIPRIIRIKRSLQMLRRTTIYQREILLRLARAEFDEIPRELVPFYRDVYDHFARVTELVDSYRELVSSLLEAQFSIQSNRMNEIMKRLTIISTIMLPLSLIAGIYGMNFEHMPELKWLYGYPYALGLMVVVATGIILYFVKKKWI